MDHRQMAGRFAIALAFCLAGLPRLRGEDVEPIATSVSDDSKDSVELAIDFSDSRQFDGSSRVFNISDRHSVASDLESDAGDWNGLGNSCPPSFWEVGAGLLLMHRTSPDGRVLAQDTTAPRRHLNANDFDFDWELGWQLSIARQLGSGRRLEARYFTVDSWNARQSVVTDSTLMNPLVINTNPTTSAPEVESVDATYGSDLDSLEINFQLDAGARLSWLIGFRYVELDEQLHLDMPGNMQFFTYDIATQNRMYGFQAGLDAQLLQRGCWTVDGAFKAIVFHNAMEQDNALLDTGVITQSAFGAADRTAFGAELAFAANYAVSDSLLLGASYSLFWLETVALASDQLPATNLFTQSGIAPDGGALYQGFFLNVTLRR